ncbi:hypothetical protein F5X68DRAFT_7380 [Plectosphaerella plurivora]|uniref:Zn(2)-C6 fungal-type domain-containing protein n=1 Tax=Plectosphaerella plurivora TaxID=936078 RepID=A0A9P8VCX7_9PEZI|nr:hypothetical protein F5X68DRAFT_7380 [Plectosphaerella plurivora]
MARLGHKKSRAGCIRCKQRKIKCDEKRPCGACAKHDMTCSLTASSPSVCGAGPVSLVSVKRRSSRRLALMDDLSLVSSPSLSLAATGWGFDLGLMNHYTSHTSSTIPGADQITWKTQVSREAVSHPFLMHQILAVAALHLASLDDDDTPLKRASLSQAYRHQHHAIRGIGAAVDTISLNNCHAVFAASFLIFIGTFASVATAQTGTPRHLDAVLDIFGLARGFGGIVDSHHDAIKRGTMRALLECNDDPPRSPLVNEVLGRLLAVSACLAPDSLSSETRSVVEVAISAMQRAASSTGSSVELNIAVVWPMYLDADFLDLARVRHPAALIVMAHYAVVLHSLGSKFWFFENLGSALIKEIIESLGPSWEETIHWPLSIFKEGGLGNMGISISAAEFDDLPVS